LEFLGEPHPLRQAFNRSRALTDVAFGSITDAQLLHDISELRSADGLAVLLGFRLSRLRAFANPKAVQFYREFSISKRDGSSRHITAPTKDLLEVQRRITRLLGALYRPPTCVHGFVSGRSQISNARAHRRCSWVLNVDLTDFFHSISYGRVRGMLMARPYNVAESVATLLAGLCCFHGRLPQGAPSSPVLAKMVAAPLDRALFKLAGAHRCRYTRYADDITFSTGNKRFPSALATRGPDNSTVVSEALVSAIEAKHFTLNERKSRLQHKSERRSVTGVLVGAKLNLPREYIRRTRAMLHAWEKFGEDAAAKEFLDRHDVKERGTDNAAVFRQSVQGRLGYLAAVKGHRDAVYQRLVVRGRQRIDDRYGSETFYALPLVEDALVVIEHDASQGTGFFLEGVGLVTCAHVVTDTVKVFNWRRPSGALAAMTIAEDHTLDLAILRTAFNPRYRLRAAATSDIEIGATIQVLGFPNWNPGRQLSVTDSVVFGAYPALSGHRLYSISHAIYGGNSGGPVLNSRGEVVGVALKGMFQGLNEGQAGAENHFIPVAAVFELARRGEGVTR
jgi:RNA-directed DNA polymerase